MVSNSIQGDFERYSPMCVCRENERKKQREEGEREKNRKIDLSEINEQKQNKEREPLSLNWLLTLAKGLL